MQTGENDEQNLENSLRRSFRRVDENQDSVALRSERR
jgi:hypothetical protein